MDVKIAFIDLKKKTFKVQFKKRKTYIKELMILNTSRNKKLGLYVL